ncbi:MAG TPA: AMP-binding protein [Woeseiaceae bacterium]|nr:AMP-binding protein [Woeseiaceae bacterium]
MIPDLLAKRAALNSQATAFRCSPGDVTISYGELEHRAQKAAGLMQSLGVAGGDRIGVLCRNRVEFFELLFACAKLGAILVPLNWRMPAVEIQALLDAAAPALLVYGAEDRATVRNLIATACVHLDLDDKDGYATQRDIAAGIKGRRLWPATDCWYLLYTSGTTGMPKAVIQTYEMAVANYVSIRHAMSISSRDVTLNFLPLFHSAGINLVTLPTLIEGGEVRILPAFDTDAVVALLADAQVDAFFAVPTIYQQMSLHPDFNKLDLGRIRSWGCGGSAMSPGLVERYLARGARVRNGMGMTETGPTAFLMEEASVADKPGSVGKPQLLSSVRIVNRDGADVEAGEHGELWFAGPGVTPGYWQNEPATREVFSADGWLKSGDLAYEDEDGDYFIVGRLKDMFISGGENVYPAEIEQLLARHPAVHEAAVVGRPDQQWGEVGCAYVQLVPGEEQPGDELLRAYCREHLAAYKVPKFFVTVDEFPRTAAGKIQKHRLGAG